MARSLWFASVLALAAASSLGAACSSASSSASPAAPDQNPAVVHPADGGDGGPVTVIDPTPSYTEDKNTQLVIGVTADSFAQAIFADLQQVAVNVAVDGKPAVDKTVALTALPLEVRVRAPQGKPDAKVDVEVRGLIDPSGPQRPGTEAGTLRSVVRKLASTSFVNGQTRLLRVLLDDRCATDSPLPIAGGAPTLGPKCDEPTTCSLGRCISRDVPTGKLEAYDAAWASHAPPDACRGPAGATATLKIGGGETDFGPLSDPLALVAGPQGGFHVWIALQTQNIGQYGTNTKISAALSDGGSPLPIVAQRTTLSPDPSGTCSIAGLRFQLTPVGSELCPMRGQMLAISVETTEADGRTTHATATARVPDVLPPVRGSDPCMMH